MRIPPVCTTMLTRRHIPYRHALPKSMCSVLPSGNWTSWSYRFHVSTPPAWVFLSLQYRPPSQADGCRNFHYLDMSALCSGYIPFLRKNETDRSDIRHSILIANSSTIAISAHVAQLNVVPNLLVSRESKSPTAAHSTHPRSSDTPTPTPTSALILPTPQELSASITLEIGSLKKPTQLQWGEE